MPILKYKNASGQWVTIAGGASGGTTPTTTSNITMFVSPSTGNDSNSGLTSSLPKKTISNALDSLPAIIEHAITINLIGTTSDVYDAVNTKLTGSGSISFNGPAILKGMTISSSGINLTYSGCTFTNPSNSLAQFTNCNVTCNSCTFNHTGITAGAYGLLVYNSNVSISDCSLTDVPAGVYAICASRGSRVSVISLGAGTARNMGLLFFADASSITYGGNAIYSTFGSPAATVTRTYAGGTIGISTDSLAAAPANALKPEDAMYPIYTNTANNWCGIGAYVDGTPWLEMGSTAANRLTIKYLFDGLYVRTGGNSGTFNKFIDYTAPVKSARDTANKYVPIVTSTGLNVVNRIAVYSTTTTSGEPEITYELDSYNMPGVTLNNPQTGSAPANTLYKGKYKVLTSADMEAPNILVNGNFSVWQRGNYFSITNSSPIYTADRWQVQRAAGTQALTVGEATDVRYGPSYMQISMSRPTGSNVIRIAQTLPSELFTSNLINGMGEKVYNASMAYAAPTSLTDPIEGTVSQLIQPTISLKVVAVGTDNKAVLSYGSNTTMGIGTAPVGGGSLEIVNTTNIPVAYYNDPLGVAVIVELSFTGDGTKDLAFRLYSVKLEEGPRCTGYGGNEPYEVNLARCQHYYYKRSSGYGTNGTAVSQYLAWSGIVSANTQANLTYLQPLMAPTEMRDATQTAEIGYSLVASSSSYTAGQKLAQTYTGGSPNNNGVVPIPTITIPTGCWMGISYYAINAELT